MKIALPVRAAFFIAMLAFPAVNLMAEWDARRLLDFVEASCRGWKDKTGPASNFSDGPIETSEIIFRGRQVGNRYRLQTSSDSRVDLDVLDGSGRPGRFVASLFGYKDNPRALVSLNFDCELQVARRINYDAVGLAKSVVSLDAKLESRGEPDWLNPPLDWIVDTSDEPPEPAPLRVAMVDSGVDYRLPEINRRLARDPDGRLIGYDFWDMDNLPFDAHPLNNGFFVQRHGTRTASLMLREAPDIELVPYRYPRPDMSRMSALIKHAERNGVSIVGMPLGGNIAEEWTAFEEAARAHPHILFIASAGNDGRDIDQQPGYPAALDLDNLVVVTSANDFVRPAERTNWGRISVDYLVPAERVSALDYAGTKTRVSGSSYAVSRITALAANLKLAHPEWQAPDIISELRRRYAEPIGSVRDWVSGGYIADPLAGTPISKRLLTTLELESLTISGGFELPLDILVLDQRWSQSLIENSLRDAYQILAQCDLAPGVVTIHAVDGADYLRDLSTGSARTLLEAAGGRHATVLFARDTLMQATFTGEAFGLGNTGMRPWLSNSVWLMPDVDDPGIALAHELFHVLANSGAHIEGSANLMQGRTRPDSTKLTSEQCRQAQLNGITNGLLFN